MNKLTLTPILHHHKNKSGQYKIYIRATRDRKTLKIPTHIYVFEKHFNGKAKYGDWIKTADPNSAVYNSQLTEKIDLLRSHESINTPTADLNTVKIIAKTGDQSKDFIAFYEKKVEQIAEYNTKKRYVTTKKKHLIPYLEKKGYSLPIAFSQIDVAFLNDFESSLRMGGMNDNYIYEQIKGVRAIWNMATSEKVVSKDLYPFGRGNYQMVAVNRTKKERLTPAEIMAFAGVNCKKVFSETYKRKMKAPADRIEFHAQQMFLLSYHCQGMRVSDTLTLTVADVMNDAVTYRMTKTKELVRIAIKPAIRSILNHYIRKDTKPTDYIFPILPEETKKMDKKSKEFKAIVSSKTTLLNRALKDIAHEAEIKKRVTNHITRNSYASALWDNTKDIMMVKKALRHKKIEITIGYLADVSNEDLDTANAAI